MYIDLHRFEHTIGNIKENADVHLITGPQVQSISSTLNQVLQLSHLNCTQGLNSGILLLPSFRFL